MNQPIHFPTEAEQKAAFAEILGREKRIRAERKNAVNEAVPALKRLAKVMCDRSGQCFKVRGLLYSLWNGKPVRLNDVLGLDWELRRDVCAVILAFGFEGAEVEFFYNAIAGEVKAVNQWKWFLEERSNVKVLREYVKAAESEAQ